MLVDSAPETAEEFYDDEEVDPNAPNPGRDNLKVPEPFEFDENVQFAS